MSCASDIVGGAVAGEDVAVRPMGESLIFKRPGVGIEDLIARL
jgi:hypothetical protein